ncbi:MAG: sterol desaturase family protein [Gracilimonas sp.]|nr:sterol desaturase family protein [Gracilimonas sp.]
MNWLYLVGFIILGFSLMEIVSYVVHRWLFHGILWKIHRSHHQPDHGLFELNDVFSLVFAGISVWLMVRGTDQLFTKPDFGIGTGIAVYGVLYFIIHDLFAHKRFIPFSSDSKIMKLIRRAHQRHHQDVGKDGHEPYGLFLFPYDKYPEHKRKFDRS